MVHSRNKGACGEREWAHFLTDHGFKAERGQQFHGGGDSPDVVCKDMPGFHAEVKRVELFNVYKAMVQASEDGEGRVPYVAHRRNNHPWVVCLWAHDFLELVKKAQAYDQIVAGQTAAFGLTEIKQGASVNGASTTEA